MALQLFDENDFHDMALRDLGAELPWCLATEVMLTRGVPGNVPKEEQVGFIMLQNTKEGYFHVGVTAKNFGTEVFALPAQIPGLIARIPPQSIVTREMRYGYDSSRMGDQYVYTNNVYLVCDELTVDHHAVVQAFRYCGLICHIRDRVARHKIRAGRPPEVFLCHDSRDKQGVARPLYAALDKFNVSCWFDAFSLLPGDSLSTAIDRGLSDCPFAVLIVSENLLQNKTWAENEFRTLQSRQIGSSEKVILPVWHGVDAKRVQSYSWWLADKFALTTINGIEPLAIGIAKVVNQRRKSQRQVLS